MLAKSHDDVVLFQLVVNLLDASLFIPLISFKSSSPCFISFKSCIKSLPVIAPYNKSTPIAIVPIFAIPPSKEDTPISPFPAPPIIKARPPTIAIAPVVPKCSSKKFQAFTAKSHTSLVAFPNFSIKVTTSGFNSKSAISCKAPAGLALLPLSKSRFTISSILDTVFLSSLFVLAVVFCIDFAKKSTPVSAFKNTFK